MLTEAPLDLLIIGAGPTGLAAAIEAHRHGLSVRVVDEKAGRSTYSKALVVHARTLEVFETMGVAGAIRAAGVPFSALNVTPTVGKAPIRIDLMDLEWGDTRYPYWLSIPQYETERCLEEHLAAQGVAVDWRVRFDGLRDRGDHVEVRLRGDGGDEVCRARWLVGCDGGRSPVREAVGLGFDRASLDETFVIADAIGAPGLPEDEGAAVLAEDGLLFLVPMPEPGRWRIIAQLAGHPPDVKVEITPALLDRLLAARMGVAFGARDLSWTSQFVLKQGIARAYRSGRVFIAGDAAHLHSPVGGQGLNTGVQDAHALLWRLALAERAEAVSDALLDSYEVERRAVAQAMVRGTTRATRLMTLRSGVLAALRGALARLLLRVDRVQRRLGRGVGMLELAYPESPIILPGPSATSGPGGRMPDPEAGGRRLCERLDPRRHTALVLEGGAAGRAVAAEIRARGAPCLQIGDGGEWPDPGGALRADLGGARVAIVRPDRVVAATAAALAPGLVDAYAGALGIAPRHL